MTDNGFIAANGSGQQLYTAFNSYMNVVGQVGFSAPTLTQAEGSSGVSDMTFTVNRTGDLWQKATVAWKVTGAGGHPVDASDFPGGVLPSGVVTPFDVVFLDPPYADPVTEMLSLLVERAL